MPVREEDLPLMLGHFSSLLLELMQFLVPLLPISNTAYTPLSDFSSLNMPQTVIPALLKKLQIVPTAYRENGTLLSLSPEFPTIWP